MPLGVTYQPYFLAQRKKGLLRTQKGVFAFSLEKQPHVKRAICACKRVFLLGRCKVYNRAKSAF